MDETNKIMVDIYRDTPVRYLGYANEVGEAFRNQIEKKWVHASYLVAIMYVLADTADKTNKTLQKHDRITKEQVKDACVTATDTVIWQMLASVVIPGFTINRLCAASRFVLKKTPIKKDPRKWLVTSIGLAAIPFIIHPIDRMVDRLMDNTYRKLF